MDFDQKIGYWARDFLYICKNPHNVLELKRTYITGNVEEENILILQCHSKLTTAKEADGGVFTSKRVQHIPKRICMHKKFLEESDYAAILNGEVELRANGKTLNLHKSFFWKKNQEKVYTSLLEHAHLTPSASEYVLDYSESNETASELKEDAVLILALGEMPSKRPSFKNQKIIETDGKFKLDKENCVILKDGVFSKKDLQKYLASASTIKRESGRSAYGSTKPRKEVCYTVDGKPYKYSRVSHYTVKYPPHVSKIIPQLLAVIKQYVPENPYQVLDTAVDILYSPAFKNGGSISAHADDEDDWGLVIVLSLGQTRWFRVRRKSDGEWYNVRMKHNSVIAMYGSTFQELYTHQVDKLSNSDDIGTRLSLNIRFK